MSLRGALNTAVDRTFGSNEGAERNREIANKGAEEHVRMTKLHSRFWKYLPTISKLSHYIIYLDITCSQ
jgi:hypothetical protein